MTQAWKKMTAFLLAAVMLSGSLPVNAGTAGLMQTVVTALAAEDVQTVVSWTSGDCTVTLDSNGVLTVSGEGAMEDLEAETYFDVGSSKWLTEEFRSEITSIVVEEGVTHIGAFAFYRCAAVSASVADSVTSIGESAFAECRSLKTVTLPEKMDQIGDCAFAWCALTSVRVPDGVEKLTRVFILCTSLTSVILPDSLKTIGEDAFNSCEALTEITLPENVAEIGTYAFMGCRSLKCIRSEACTPPAFGSDPFQLHSGEILFWVPLKSLAAYQESAEAYNQRARNRLPLAFAAELPDTNTTTYYKQTAWNEYKNIYYTRFVFAVPRKSFRGASSVLYTVTDSRTGQTYTRSSRYYYTGMITNDVHYATASGDSVLFVVTVSHKGEDISDQLTCTLAFD